LCTIKYCSNVSLIEASVEWFNSIHTKFIFKFLDTPSFSINFGSLNYFLRIKSIEKQLKQPLSAGLRIRPTATVHRAWWPATCGRSEGWLDLDLAARSSGGVARVLARDHERRARSRRTGASWWRGAHRQSGGRGGRQCPR
jgi:hypothetical protein